VISGGNFHAEPVAMAADNIALAIAEIGSLSERRIALMMDSHMSQLPPFLQKRRRQLRLYDCPGDGGGAGQREQSAVAPAQRGQPADLRQPGRPRLDGAGRRSPPVGDGGKHPRRAGREWLAAVQGLDMREGLTSSPLLEEARHLLRERVTHYTEDRFFAPDIETPLRFWRRVT
jgi:histidine ammonia-lyase